MKSVYVVLPGWNYEGYDTPYGVYASLKSAKKAKDECMKERRGDYVEVFKMEIGNPNSVSNL